MYGELIPCGGGQPVPLLKPKLLVGRRSDCDVPLPFPSVSARHCELHLRDGYWFVRDVGSKNGIRVDGTRCDSDWLLPGSILSVAQHRYQVSYTPRTDRPAPKRKEDAESPAPGARRRSQSVSSEESPTGTSAGSKSQPEQEPKPLGHLLPCGGGDPVALLRAKLVVGRRDDCDVVLRFPSVSSQHCELEYRDGYWFVRDLGSTNGTRVDGVRCQRQCLLPGCQLWISKHRYEVAYRPPADAAAPPEADPFRVGLLEKAGLAKDSGSEGADWPSKDEGPKRKRWKLD